MIKTFSAKNIALLLVASGLVLTAALAQTTQSRQKQSHTDTLPSKQKKVRDLDEALLEIDKGEIEMNRAFAEMDREKIESDIRKAMKDMKVDMNKMQEEVAKALKEVDMEKIQVEVQKALAEVDMEKVRKDVRKSLATVDMEKVKADVQKATEHDFPKMQAELEKIQPEIEKAMKEAKADIEKARKEIIAYKNLVDALDKDGLLDKNSEYRIEYKNSQLTVNGKLLPEATAKKYTGHLAGKKDFTLKKGADELNIDND